MAAATDHIWDLQQAAPPAVTAAAPTRDRSRSPYSGGRNSRRDTRRRSPSNHRRGRAQTPHHSSQENENGIVVTTTGKQRALPMTQTAHQEETAEIKKQQQCPFHMALDCCF
jgi:hypothetical protein